MIIAIIYTILVFSSWSILDHLGGWRRVVLALALPAICIGFGLFALVHWLLTLPERMG